MNRKRNVSFIKPEDPNFLKVLKKQVGYDTTNHKFDKPENSEEDFVSDDDSELPQMVVLKKGDLTAEEAEIEKANIEKAESEIRADLTQKVIFKGKSKQTNMTKVDKKRDKIKTNTANKIKPSFADEDFDDET